MRPGVVKIAAMGLLALLMLYSVASVSWPEGDMDLNSNEAVGETMFGTPDSSGYGVVVLLVGVLLLVAMLGGVFLAKEEDDE
jgi:NADH:ubiquinone oxidoreductase subunit 6 (subunit J)